MDRAEYLAEYCASIDCKSKKLGDCDLCMYEKGRADCLDECIKLVGGNTKTIVGIVFDNSIPIHDRALGRMAKNKLIEELVEQLEQLKGNSNEE